MPLGGLATAGLIAAGAGLVTKTIGNIKKMNDAKRLARQANLVPKAERSQYASQMLGATQMAANANPLQAALQRSGQQAAASSIYQARQVADPSQMLGMIAGTTGKAQEMDLNAALQGEQMKDRRMGAYYNALQTNVAEDENFFNRRMAEQQSKINIQQAANQMKHSAWQGIGGDMINFGGSLIGAKGGGKTVPLMKGISGGGMATSNMFQGAVPSYQMNLGSLGGKF